MDVPLPHPSPTQVLVKTSRSVVSAGTERAVKQLASASLLQKAKARPDLVKQVISKARAEGIRSTAESVRNKLDDFMPLGYSAAGIAVDVGEHVEGIRPGMRVATGGAGHGDYQLVNGLLTVPIPDEVDDINASFATVASIAMHGIRLADLGPGSHVCVIGLGLIGQITCRLAQASGYIVSGIDLKDFAIEKATESGVFALKEEGEATTRAIIEWSKGRGVDAVLITAASKSSGPVSRATEIARDTAPIVIVGDVGMELDRRPFFEKELTLKVARSYGPGRYERAYEDWGVDYPAGQVRWTEGRNLESVLDLLAAGSVDFTDLVTHDFALENAAEAYEIIEGSDPFFGVQLTYGAATDPHGSSILGLRPLAKVGANRIGLLGAGNFSKATLLPALQTAKFGFIQGIASQTGVSARYMAEKYEIPFVATDAEELINHEHVDIVMISTPHDTHADLVLQGLKAGKHVFCEKPLAMTHPELDEIETALEGSGTTLHVGFNRRYSPPAVHARQIFGSSGGPLVINYRVNSGELPASHWYKDRRFGGRLLGEACHYVDFAGFLSNDEPPSTIQVVRSGRGEPLLDEDFVISLAYPNGNVATITYASHGHAGMSKERIDVIGRGHAVCIDDFKSIEVDGKVVKGVSGRGHSDQFAHFDRMIRAGGSDPSGLTSMRATISAAGLLRA